MKLLDLNYYGQAPNGTVTIYRRGTSTAATVYSDYKGRTNITDTAGQYDIDSTGRLLLYVNEPVDVTVSDSAGTTVDSFTALDQATTTEVLHNHITGTDYDTAMAGLGKPTTVQGVLDKVYTSFGGDDFKVLIGSTQYYIKDALSTLGGIFFNVKGASYGALGDGSHDDTSAIQAAINASDSAGGIVYFPPGDYRITSALTTTGKTSFLGCGANASSIGIDHASNHLLTVSSNPTYQTVEIKGLRLYAKQTNTGRILNLLDNRVAVRDCHIGGSNSTGTALAYLATSNVFMFENCYFQPAGATTAAVYSNSAGTGIVRISGGTIEPLNANRTGVNNALVYCTRVHVSDVRFNCAAVTGAGAIVYCVVPGSSTGSDVVVTGCKFVAPASVGQMYIFAPGSMAAGEQFYENNNSWDLSASPPVIPYTVLYPPSSKSAQINLQSRESRPYHLAAHAGGTTDLDLNTYGIIFIEQTSGATLTVTGASGLGGVSHGSRLRFFWHNASGSNITPTFSGTYFKAVSSGVVNNGQWLTGEFMYDGTQNKWTLMGGWGIS